MSLKKLDLLTSTTVVLDDAMKFVSDNSNNSNKKLISKKVNNGESKEPDYDEKDSDKQGEEMQEQGTGESSQAQTINQVF